VRFVPHIRTLQIIYNLHSINQALTVLMAFIVFTGIHHVRDDISELVLIVDGELKKVINKIPIHLFQKSINRLENI